MNCNQWIWIISVNWITASQLAIYYIQKNIVPQGVTLPHMVEFMLYVANLPGPVVTTYSLFYQ